MLRLADFQVNITFHIQVNHRIPSSILVSNHMSRTVASKSRETLLEVSFGRKGAENVLQLFLNHISRS
jgi:hypothetical protein